MCMCVRARAHVHNVCARAYVHAHGHVCMHLCMHVTQQRCKQTGNKKKEKNSAEIKVLKRFAGSTKTGSQA